jgi:hypothetical protein
MFTEEEAFRNDEGPAGDLADGASTRFGVDAVSDPR